MKIAWVLSSPRPAASCRAVVGPGPSGHPVVTSQVRGRPGEATA